MALGEPRIPRVAGIDLGSPAGDAIDAGLAVAAEAFGPGSEVFTLIPTGPGEVVVCVYGEGIDELREAPVNGFIVKDRSWRTGAGITVGSTEAALREAYPGLRELGSSMWGIVTPHDYGLQFYVPGRSVETIGVGRGIGREIRLEC